MTEKITDKKNQCACLFDGEGHPISECHRHAVMRTELLAAQGLLAELREWFDEEQESPVGRNLTSELRDIYTKRMTEDSDE